MNQSGSRNGLGTDGPGYVFPDETANGLSHVPFVISMANSGTNTNGSQFFVTAVATTYLDGVHSVFGTVTAGQSVVTAINNVPTASDKPLTPVIIQSVKIRRVGTAAQAFDMNAQFLPQLSNPAYTLSKVDLKSRVEALPVTPRAAGTIFSVFRTEDLQTWSRTGSFYLGLGNTNSTAVTIDALYGFATDLSSRAFYRFSQAYYPDAMIPQSLASKTLKVTWGTQALDFTFNADGTAGSSLYSLDSVTRPVTTIYESTSPYDWIFEITGFGSIKVSTFRTGESATAFTGIQKIQQWQSGSWLTIGTGIATLSK